MVMWARARHHGLHNPSEAPTRVLSVAPLSGSIPPAGALAQSIGKVEWIASKHPETLAEKAQIFSTAPVRATFSDGSVTEAPLSYELVMTKRTRVGTNASPTARPATAGQAGAPERGPAPDRVSPVGVAERVSGFGRVRADRQADQRAGTAAVAARNRRRRTQVALDGDGDQVDADRTAACRIEGDPAAAGQVDQQPGVRRTGATGAEQAPVGVEQAARHQPRRDRAGARPPPSAPPDRGRSRCPAPGVSSGACTPSASRSLQAMPPSLPRRMSFSSDSVPVRRPSEKPCAQRVRRPSGSGNCGAGSAPRSAASSGE